MPCAVYLTQAACYPRSVLVCSKSAAMEAAAAEEAVAATACQVEELSTLAHVARPPSNLLAKTCPGESGERACGAEVSRACLSAPDICKRRAILPNIVKLDKGDHASKLRLIASSACPEMTIPCAFRKISRKAETSMARACGARTRLLPPRSGIASCTGGESSGRRSTRRVGQRLVIPHMLLNVQPCPHRHTWL